MAGHAHYKPYGAFSAPHVSRTHTFIGKALGATMWFWIFYRIREDGPVMFGLKHPWENHGSGHGHAIEHKEEH